LKRYIDFGAALSYDAAAMKRTLILVALITLFSPLMQGQSKRVTLDLGTVTVWIGMPKQEAFSKLATAGYKLMTTSDEDTADGKIIAVLSGDELYSIAFTAGRLSFADRDWYNKNTSVADAVIDSLRTVAGPSGATCKVIPDTLSNPESSLKRVFVQCGTRTILIMKGKIGKAENLVTVSERIGDYYGDTY
jgi:hypothetical protein